jgi:hypothetical protein
MRVENAITDHGEMLLWAIRKHQMLPTAQVG